jgi:hypothetical protein
VLLWIDIVSGMPAWWTVMEGPFGVGMGAVYLILQFRSRVEVLQKQAAAWTASPASPAEQEAEEEEGPTPPAALDDAAPSGDAGARTAPDVSDDFGAGSGGGLAPDLGSEAGADRDTGDAAGPDEPERDG